MAFQNLKSTGIAYLLTKLKGVFQLASEAVKSVNQTDPDANGNITINTVPFAQNLESDSSFRNYETFIERTSGGESSVKDGSAWLMSVKGNNIHEGYAPAVIDVAITPDRDNQIEVDIDQDVFVSAVPASGTITLTYSSSWSADPATYGITITGTPQSGDTITIDYTAEEAGTITVANPQTFVATGWNLYNGSTGYARVVAYAWRYRIDGAYTALQFSQTVGGARSSVTVDEDSTFIPPSDGFVWVTGGNSSSTAIYPAWDDWESGHDGDFHEYEEYTIDFSEVMGIIFPDGLLKAGSVADEINLNLGQAISRVERIDNDAENMAEAKASGREFEYDENYIYIAKATATQQSITSYEINNAFTVNQHGLEFYTGTDVPVVSEILYGVNLKNKLERDVLTISQQELTANQQKQVRKNIGVSATSDFDELIKVKTYTYTYGVVSANGAVVVTGKKFNVATPSGYTPVGIVEINTDASAMFPYFWNATNTGSNPVLKMRNILNSATSTSHTCSVKILYVKKTYA